MSARDAKLHAEPAPANGDSLTRAARERREADWALPMNERLARLHELCKQMSAVKGSARRG